MPPGFCGALWDFLVTGPWVLLERRSANQNQGLELSLLHKMYTTKKNLQLYVSKETKNTHTLHTKSDTYTEACFWIHRRKNNRLCVGVESETVNIMVLPRCMCLDCSDWHKAGHCSLMDIWIANWLMVPPSQKVVSHLFSQQCKSCRASVFHLPQENIPLQAWEKAGVRERK